MKAARPSRPPFVPLPTTESYTSEPQPAGSTVRSPCAPRDFLRSDGCTNVLLAANYSIAAQRTLRQLVASLPLDAEQVGDRMLRVAQLTGSQMVESDPSLRPLHPFRHVHEVPDLVDRLLGVALVDRGEREPQVQPGDPELGLGLAGQHLLDGVLSIVELAGADVLARAHHRLAVLAIVHGRDDVTDVVERILGVLGRQGAERVGCVYSVRVDLQGDRVSGTHTVNVSTWTVCVPGIQFGVMIR